MIENKKVVFLYNQQPQPLPVHMLNLLGRAGAYEVALVYFERLNSPVSIPLSGLLNEMQVSKVTWRVGNNPISKAFNRGVVAQMFINRIKALKPDVIHAWNLEMLLYARLAGLALKQVKIVFSLQDTTRWMLSPLAQGLQRWLYRRVALFFVTSQGFEAQFLRRFNLIAATQKVVYVPNVPPAEQFAHFEPRKPENELTVGYIGTLRGEEGIRMLVEAAQMARQDGANVRVLFAGTGREGELVRQLAGENDFITYQGPYRHDGQIQDLYARVDLIYGLYDRSYDKQIHLAYRLCEAVNCRLPIIAAKGTHMAEVVESHGIGVCVGMGDVAGLAGELSAFYRHPEKRMLMAAKCKDASAEFVFEHFQEKICEAYAGLWKSTSVRGRQDQE
jgi:succinoglycan biosynthesis protein ExoL